MLVNISYLIDVEKKDFEIDIQCSSDTGEMTKDQYNELIAAYLETIIPGKSDILIMFLQKIVTKYPEIYSILSEKLENKTPLVNSTDVLKIFND